MIRVGVIGCGYWGPKLARNFAGLADAELVALCDPDEGQLEAVGRHYPAARRYRDATQLLSASEIDAVAIATPVETHFALATAAFEAGKHVMVEKPLANSVADARALVAQAESTGRTLLVDHTFLYSGAVRKLRSILDANEIGDVLYIDSVRINLGLFHRNVNVLWDLAPHDVSIMTHLIDVPPVWVSAVGRAHYGEQECQAYVTIQFGKNILAHMHVNWLAPVKLRSTVIGGSKKMIVYDDLEPSERVRIYEKGVTLNDDAAGRNAARVGYRTGDMHAPYIDNTEPLQVACTDFVRAIRTGERPLADGRSGLAVVEILAAAQQSLRQDGERMLLAPAL